MDLVAASTTLSSEIIDANNYILFFNALVWGIIFGFIAALLIRSLSWLWRG